jgi:hypothetical protein
MRGLFSLGLLAIVTAFRIGYKEITVVVDGNSYNVTGFFDIMVILWSLYAFFMVMGLSGDILGENLSRMFRRISRYYLLCSYVFLGFLAIVFYYTMYGIRAIGLSVFVLALVLYWSGKRLYLFRKRWPEQRLSVRFAWNKLVNYLKSEWYQFLLSVFIACLLLVVAGTHEEFVLPSSIIGSIFLILGLVARDKKKRTTEKEREAKG